MSLSSDARGATAIEYALIASLIAMVIVGAASQVGGTLQATFTMIAGAF